MERVRLISQGSRNHFPIGSALWSLSPSSMGRRTCLVQSALVGTTFKYVLGLTVTGGHLFEQVGETPGMMLLMGCCLCLSVKSENEQCPALGVSRVVKRKLSGQGQWKFCACCGTRGH